MINNILAKEETKGRKSNINEHNFGQSFIVLGSLVNVSQLGD